MAKTYRKLGRRGLKSNIARFISILIIVALGSGFLVGLLTAPFSMEERTDDYLDSHNMYDINIKSTLGITEEDIEEISKIKNVSKTFGVNITDVFAKDSLGEGHVTRFMSVPFENLELIEGRLPQNSNEVVIEIINSYGGINEDIKSLNISEGNRDYETIKENMKELNFEVVGIVQSPYYISIEGGMSQSGQGEIDLAGYLMEDAFDNKGIYTDIFIEIEGAKKINAFDEEYEKIIQDSLSEIEKVGDERSALRTEEVKAEALEELEEPKREFENAKAEALSKIEDGREQLERAEKDIEEGKKAIEAGRESQKQLQDQIKTLEPVDPATAAILKEQEKALDKQLDEQEILLEAAQKELEEGREELAKEESIVLAQLSEAEEEIEKAENEIAEIEACEWLYFDRSDNIGIKGYKDNVDKVRAISAVFPVFFFAVTILVALTTMTRMIEEERLQIGILKALGHTNKSVLSYYLTYSLTASVIGSLIGIGIGFIVFPMIIDEAYSMLYTLPVLPPKPILFIILPVSLVIIFSVGLSTYFSCRSEQKEKPAALLIPKAPKLGKRIFLERITVIWRKIKFSHKVTLRNIFRYKKRLLMTIVGIAGSFALLITGFGLRDSIGDIVELQYDEITKYDFMSKVSEEKWIEEDEDLENLIGDQEYIKNYALFQNETVTVYGNSDEDVEGSLIIAKENDSMEDYYKFRTRVFGTEIEFNENSLIITEKLSEEISVDVGDEVQIELYNGEKKAAKVTGICENYVGHSVYMGNSMYENTFNTALEFTTILGNINYEEGTTDEEVLDQFAKSENVDYTLMRSDIQNTFADSVKSINYIVIMIIVCAGALVLVVLYNLININVCERKKELATIEVLGFYNKEVYSYIFRETNLLCLIGIVVGLPFGASLHRFVIHVAEVEGVMFGREISLASYVYSFMFAVFFVLIVNRIMRRSIKKINMVESMKAND